MKKARWALPLLVLFIVPGVCQVEQVIAGQIEHAPTPEQCRADADAWGVPTVTLFTNTEQVFTQLSTGTASNKNLTANMLDARMKEFSQCMRTDSMFSVRYAEANRAYTVALLLRMANFMRRHDLTSQFLTEDEQGQR